MDTPTRFCSSCGKPVTPGVAFCNSCGAPLAGGAPAGAPQGPSWWSRQSLGVKIAVIAVPLALIGAIVGLSVGLAARSDNAQTKVMNSQRMKAQDAAAKSLVRNSMTAIESAYVDIRTFSPAIMTPEVLASIEPSITFVAMGSTAAATAPTAQASDDAVDYVGTTTTYAVGSVSESGKTFGVIVDKGAGGGNQFYVDGEATDW